MGSRTWRSVPRDVFELEMNGLVGQTVIAATASRDVNLALRVSRGTRLRIFGSYRLCAQGNIVAGSSDELFTRREAVHALEGQSVDEVTPREMQSWGLRVGSSYLRVIPNSRNGMFLQLDVQGGRRLALKGSGAAGVADAVAGRLSGVEHSESPATMVGAMIVDVECASTGRLTLVLGREQRRSLLTLDERWCWRIEQYGTFVLGFRDRTALRERVLGRLRGKVVTKWTETATWARALELQEGYLLRAFMTSSSSHVAVEPEEA